MKTFFLGVIVAVLVVGAYVFIQNQNDDDKPPAIMCIVGNATDCQSGE